MPGDSRMTIQKIFDGQTPASTGAAFGSGREVQGPVPEVLR